MVDSIREALEKDLAGLKGFAEGRSKVAPGAGVGKKERKISKALKEFTGALTPVETRLLLGLYNKKVD